MALIDAIVGVLVSKTAIVILIIGAVLFYVGRSYEQEVDEKEPPAIRSRVPYIGHVIQTLWEGPWFLKNLNDKHHLPIATLPIMNKKAYAIWDPYLVQSAYCSKDLSFIPFAVDNVKGVTGFDDFSDELVKKTNILPEYFKRIYDGTTAQHIHHLNVASMKYVSAHMNGIGKDGLEVDNIYMYLRDLMTVATCEALFGPRNPIKEQQLVDDVWTFEDGLPLLMFHLRKSKMLQDTLDARKRIQNKLGEYFEGMNEEDPEVSAYIKYRVGVLRKYGMNAKRIGDIEVALIHVPTSNSIPTLFWYFIYVFTRPELVEKLRAECEPYAQHGDNNEVTFNCDTVNENCHLLVSSYKEAARMCNKFVCNRRVIKETTVTDRQGNSYLLKKGASIRMPAGILHATNEAWGPDADEFRADRFLDKGLGREEAKLRRNSHTPFGGGAHMCPGRNFATAEILSFMASLLVGYRIAPKDGNWDKFHEPAMAPCPLATSVCKPEGEKNMFGMRVTRREGWEDAVWRFTSGKLSP